jgi:hypothetical protein
MSKGNRIVVSANPRGVFLEGVLTAVAVSPGTMMEFTSTAPIGGRHTWQCFQRGSDGQKALVSIAQDDALQGQPMTSAYATSARVFMYCPESGEEMNILLKDIVGTGDTHTQGEYEICNSGTGKFIVTTGSPGSEPFRLLEAITPAPTADTLAWAMATGM